MSDLMDTIKRKFRYDPETGRIYRRSDGELADTSIGAQGYRRVSVKRDAYKSAHRVAYALMTGEWPSKKMHVHHKNSVRTDNRWENLTLVTPRENVGAIVRREDTGITLTSSGNGFYVSCGTTVPTIEMARAIRAGFNQIVTDIVGENQE